MVRLAFLNLTLLVPIASNDSGLLAILLAGAWVLNSICRWRWDGQLETAPAYTFQFSLGSLMALVLGIATYISVLVFLAEG